ncbi:GNAT family N-acetyltransferase [Shimia abyssi]|uniref:Phosphinothricin acetyltransferase n=1 Tax=Shimia abyssi TaxID=1662395 RepID=A0A2P8FK09_9RHOB|nr:GNAT family N-acetyltransferase [Shimia abyssi]PSL22056.1 phosphinothricin acetyltransferase [Shimia abyssi]
MKVRNATIKDRQAITQIWNAEIRNGVSTFTTAEKSIEAVGDAIERDNVVVVEHGTHVVGFGALSSFRTGPGYRHTMEHSIYLDASSQGRGWGGALLKALEKKAKRKGTRVLVAAISGENAGAVQFHSRLGYTKVAEMPEVGYKFGRWLDLVLMQKML